MSDPDDSKSASGIPAWQRESQHSAAESPSQSESTSQETKSEDSAEDNLEVARRFLEDDEIKNSPREKKEEFLKTKGLSSSEIEELLGNSSASEAAQEIAQTEPVPADPATITTPEPHSTSPNDVSLPRANDNPPVVTYPEFLTKPSRPPPLITANGIFNTLYAFAGISTLLYGTSKFVVAPMVENLNEARDELHETTSQKLSAIIEKLEGTVSEIPSKKHTVDQHEDNASSSDDTEDPSELFHRDIGTQTSFPSSPRLGVTSGLNEKTEGPQPNSSKLENIARFANQIKDTCTSETDDLVHIKSSMDLLKDDLMQMAYPAPKDFSSGLYGYRSNEPDDEIKKVKDNIRRIKGVMLSTRNFPASVR
nr:peroxin 14 17 [Colletotrichum truncatum]KAF6793549.1 peroxin 14 17 [Colletotrichum truncatum]